MLRFFLDFFPCARCAHLQILINENEYLEKKFKWIARDGHVFMNSLAASIIHARARLLLVGRFPVYCCLFSSFGQCWYFWLRKLTVCTEHTHPPSSTTQIGSGVPGASTIALSLISSQVFFGGLLPSTPAPLVILKSEIWVVLALFFASGNNINANPISELPKP